MGVRSSPNGTFLMNTGLPHQVPDDLRVFKNEVDVAIRIVAGGEFNVRETKYGAPLTGIATDLPAILNAFDDAASHGGGNVLLGPSLTPYIIDGSIDTSLYPNVNLLGPGKRLATLKRKDSSTGGDIITLSAGKIIKGFSVDGNRSHNVGHNAIEVKVVGAGVTLQSVEVFNSEFIGVAVFAPYCTLLDCDITGIGDPDVGGYIGVYADDPAADDLTIIGGLIKDWRANGVGSFGNGGARTRLLGVKFKDNHRHFATTGGGQICLRGQGGHQIIGCDVTVEFATTAVQTIGAELAGGTIVQDSLFNGGGFQRDGITIQEGTHYVITGNVATGYDFGLYITEALGATDHITENNNDWSGCGTAIHNESAGLNNKIWGERLQVSQSGAMLSKNANSTLGPTLTLQNPGGAGDTAIDLVGYNPGANAAALRLRSVDSNYSAHLDLYTKEPGAPTNALVFRARFTKDGKLGIGTTNISDPLTLSVSTGTLVGFRINSSINESTFAFNNTAAGGREYMLFSTGGGSGLGQGKFAIYDRTANLTRFAINSAGKVGIGTATALAHLHVVSTAEQLRLEYDISNYASFIVNSNGNISLTQLPTTSRLQTATYVSQLTGWAITYSGDADFRYIYADQLHAKSFIADLEQALAGGQIISKSVAEVAIAFALPAAGGAGTLTVKDLPSAAGMAVFQSGDIVRLRQFSRAAGALIIADAWGVVTSYSDLGNGTQTWTFTRSSGSLAGTATGTIAKNTLALDYGTTGNGFHEVNAVDGAYGVNSPYSQIVTWATHPQNGQTIRTRTGNLLGVTGSTEYGLYAGDGGIAAANKFIRISNANFEIHNIGLQIYDSTTKVIELNQAGPYFALGNPMPTTFLENSTEGIWMGKVGSDYSMRVGVTDSGGNLTAGWKWDGSTNLATFIGGGTFSGALSAATGTFVGAVTAGGGNAALNANGFSLTASPSYGVQNSFKILDSVTGNVITNIYDLDGTPSGIAHILSIVAESVAGKSSYAVIQTKAPTGKTSSVGLESYNSTTNGNYSSLYVYESGILLSTGGGATPNPMMLVANGVTIGANSAPNATLDVRGNTIIISTARTPASASATGATGSVCWDASFVYICTATNTWKRTAIATW